MFAARSTSFPFLPVQNTIRRGLKKAARCSAVLVLVSATVGLADVYSYDCDSLPEDAGWTLLQEVCDLQQWTSDGLLFQEVPLCEEFPGFGARIDHEKDVEDLEALLRGLRSGESSQRELAKS